MVSSLTVLALLEKVHDRVAAFARGRHATEGRGVVLIELPDLEGSPDTIVASLQYTRESQVHMLFGGGRGRADSKSLVRLLEQYDPAVQAVVNVRLRDQDHALMVRLRL